MFFVFLLVLMLVSLAAQHFIGELPVIGARVFLMQIVMFYGALALPTWGMLALVFAGGLMWDLLHVQIIVDHPEIGIGWSIVLYAMLGSIMSGLRPLFLKGRWEIHAVLCGLCVSAIVLAEYLMLSIRRQPVVFHFDQQIWWRIGGAGLTALFIAPFLFLALNYVAYLMGHELQPEEKDER